MEVTLSVSICSDIICPWCLLGHSRLAQTLAQIRAWWEENGHGINDDCSVGRRRPRLRMEKTWVPHVLMPRLDPEAKVLKPQSYLRKFGGDERKVDEMEQTLRRLFEKEIGTQVAYTLDGYLGSSLHAHRVAEHAKDISSECQTAFVLECMRRYHELGRAPSDLGNLQEVADACGLGISNMREWIDSGEKLGEVATALARATVQFPMMSGVPFFHFSLSCRDANGTPKIVSAFVPGAQDSQTFIMSLVNLFRRAGYELLDLRRELTTPSMARI